MQVHIRHEFQGTTCEQVERLYLWDERFNREAFARMRHERVVLEQVRENRVLVRTLCIRPLRSVPAPFAVLLGPNTLQIEEHLEYDLARHEGTWRTTPSVLKQHFAATGTLSIQAVERSVVFEMRGDVTCSLPLLGKRAERHAVATAEEQHALLANEVRARLAQMASSGVEQRRA
jgi:hypothetical protein